MADTLIHVVPTLSVPRSRPSENPQSYLCRVILRELRLFDYSVGLPTLYHHTNMAMVKLPSLLLAWQLVPLVFAQAPKDPTQDVCRRFGHQTAVIDKKLYIDGGWLYASPMDQNPQPTMSA